jgi:hypothetical protein
MDRAFKEALEAGTAESFRRYGVDATLNGKKLQVIPSSETESFSFGDSDFSSDGTMEIQALTADWKRLKLAKLPSNRFAIEGTEYNVISARLLPGVPTVQLSLRVPRT